MREEWFRIKANTGHWPHFIDPRRPWIVIWKRKLVGFMSSRGEECYNGICILGLLFAVWSISCRQIKRKPKDWLEVYCNSPGNR